MIALYAAALRPDRVRSLTVSEPGCLRVASGDPRVDAQVANGARLYEHASELGPLQFLLAFRPIGASTRSESGHVRCCRRATRRDHRGKER